MNAVLKLPPFSVEAEQAVLGACLLKSELFHELPLRESDFYRADHRIIWRAIRAQSDAGNSFDAVTLSDWLAQRGEIEQAGGLAYLATLARDTPTVENGKHYAAIVRERARKREMLAALAGASDALHGASETAEVAATLQISLESMNRTGGDLAFSEVLKCGEASMERVLSRNASGNPGLTFGLPTLDHVLGGLSGNQLVILAARPSLGKTALAHQMAMRAIGRHVPIGKIELEMSAAQIAHRSIAYAYEMNVTEVVRGERVADIARAAARHNIRDYPLWIDERAFTLPEICSRIAEWHRKHKIELAVVDYLQLIAGGGARNSTRAQDLGLLTRGLKLLAKRLNIPLLVLCQLTRDNEREKRRPQLSDLRESGNIEQDADIVIALHGVVDADESGNRDVEIGVLKQREGRVGWLDQYQFRFRGRIQHFEEMTDGARPIQRPSDRTSDAAPSGRASRVPYAEG